MTQEQGNPVEELPVHECWELLRNAPVGRLAVWVEDHPDIFPVNYVVDHGTLVLRSGEGAKVSAALADVAVALETDGYDASSWRAWSVVVRGRAARIQQVQELMDAVDLPLFPWQEGRKGIFVRITPQLVTGRRFPVADPELWRTPLSDVRRAPRGVTCAPRPQARAAPPSDGSARRRFGVPAMRRAASTTSSTKAV